MLLDSFSSRILFGAQKELLELMRIHPILQQTQRARFLYTHGYRSASAIAGANVDAFAKLLRRFVPFERVSAEADSGSVSLRPAGYNFLHYLFKLANKLTSILGNCSSMYLLRICRMLLLFNTYAYCAFNIFLYVPDFIAMHGSWKENL